VLVNVVDVPDRCDFYAASVVRSGPVTLAIGTSGTSPSVSVALRRRLEALLAEEVGELAERLGARRPELLARFGEYRDRARRLNAAAEVWLAGLMDEGLAPESNEMDRWIDAILACDQPCEGPCACALRSLAAFRVETEA
jgi:siroheme synthase-like protein